jgi:hypothetical protein
MRTFKEYFEEAHEEGHTQIIKFPDENSERMATKKFFKQAENIIQPVDRDVEEQLRLSTPPFLGITYLGSSDHPLQFRSVQDTIFFMRSSHFIVSLSQGTPDDIIDWWEAELADLSGDPGQGREPADPGEGGLY